jgi:hypothetical protein
MVTLFMGLFTAAGIMPQRVKASPSKRTSTGSGPTKTKSAIRRSKDHSSLKEERQQRNHPGDNVSRLPPAIAGLLATLPPDGGYWTKERRDGFMATLGAVIDYTFKIGEPPKTEADTTPATGQ